MASSETRYGPTPKGGVKSMAMFFDKEGKPVDKSKAKQVEITEYDAAGNIVGRTYGTIGDDDASEQ